MISDLEMPAMARRRGASYSNIASRDVRLKSRTYVNATIATKLEESHVVDTSMM
jgi:hypothetical protein